MSSSGLSYQRNPDFIFRKIVEETILVPLHKGVAEMDCIYSLNPLGAFIWENLDQPATRETLESVILNEFDVTAEVARKDLDNFLDAMLGIGALQQV